MRTVRRMRRLFLRQQESAISLENIPAIEIRPHFKMVTTTCERRALGTCLSAQHWFRLYRNRNFRGKDRSTCSPST